jgi:DNA primase
MDVIQLVQSGIKNVVASGGTALTYQQIRLIHRFTENINLLYDGDKAGIKAAMRGIDMMLEEGLNVRIILLPDGEDPDSFARKTNAADLQEFLLHNQQDFIRFKTKLLSEEADNDPTKRSEMITTIARSIAMIPDIIKRQVYVKETAALLTFPEDILAKKVRELRAKHMEDIKRKATPATQTAAEEPLGSTPSPTTIQTPPQLVNIPQVMTPREKNILNLLQVIVRYGEHIIYQFEDGRTLSVGEYIINELHADNIEFDSPLHKQILDEFSNNYSDEFIAATFYQYHPDPAINQFAAEMIADKYQLSRMYNKQTVSENVVQEVERDEREDLPEVVQRLLLELKYTIVTERLDALHALLEKANGDWQMQLTLLEQKQLLEQIRTQLCKALGNRVIV